MTYIIDKDIPIPQIRRSKAAKYANTLSEMDVGDRELFPWNKDREGNLITGVNNQRASSDGNAFIGYLRTKGCKFTSRSQENGRRVWLLEKNI